MTAAGPPGGKFERLSAAFGAGAVKATLIGLAGGAGLFLAWMASGALLLIFAGLLFAALLDACTRGLSTLSPLRRSWNLAIVSVTIAIVATGLLFWSGFSVAQQISDLVHALNQQLRVVERGMAELGFTPGATVGSTPIGHLGRLLFPNWRQLFGEARSAFTLAIGGIGQALIAVLIGLFVALDPDAYGRGIVELMPERQRAATAIVLNETALYLRRWLIGQLVIMLLLAVLTTIMLFSLGVPSSAPLGVLAGLFNFVPYLGAILAGAPILLMTLPLGATKVLIVLGLYTIIHVGVGYAVTPVIQKQAVHLPPAVTLASLVLFGALFGFAGVALATPLVAAIRHAVLQLQHLPAADESEAFAAPQPAETPTLRQ
jgi:predicted PurR-regulated permease PerM